MDNKKRIEDICKRAQDLKDANSNWLNYFQQLSEFCLPRKAQITEKRSPGDKLKMDKIYDSTAMRSLKILASGMHSNLTNPSSKWFNLRTRNIKIMDSRDVQLWFKEVEDTIFGALASSNFDTTMQEFYLNSGCFGTGVVLTLEDVREKVRFSEIAIDQVVMEEDAYGRVNRVYRTFKMTAQQAFDLWGNNAGEHVLEIVKKKPNDKIEFLHYVGPRDRRDPSKEDNSNMPFESLWIEKSKKHLIGEGGFQELPYAVGRFYKDSDEVMGFSPAMDALYEIKGVNAQKKTLLRAAMKAADPAIIAPRKGWIAPLNANPGRINYYEKRMPDDQVSMFPSSGNIPITLEIIQAEQNSIKETFFVPLFQALSQITKQMTVPEVQQRIAENMVLLGPTIGRFTQEMLDPILTRVFGILLQSGEFPVPPFEIQGEEMDIVYISPLARAQRQSEIYSVQAFMQDVGMLATGQPSVTDKIDWDRGVDIIAQVRGIDPSLIRQKGDVDKVRELRAKAQMQQMQAAALQQGAETVAMASGATKDMADAKAVKA
jgi:hypothetical protein